MFSLYGDEGNKPPSEAEATQKYKSRELLPPTGVLPDEVDVIVEASAQTPGRHLI